MRYWILESGLLLGLSLFLSKVLSSKLQDIVQERCECRFRFGVGFFLLFFLHGIPSEIVGGSGVIWVIFGVPRPRHRFSLLPCAMRDSGYMSSFDVGGLRLNTRAFCVSNMEHSRTGVRG